MNERMRESLSALLDGEANELELERVLASIGEDESLRRTWSRYAAVSTVTGNQRVAHLELDISARVSAALADRGSSGSSAVATGLRQRWLRPLGSFAVAASVAATVIVGGQHLAQISHVQGGGAEAGNTALLSPVINFGNRGTALPATYGSSVVPSLQSTTPIAYRELAQQRMVRYMQDHAEQAALNVPQGLISFARVPVIHE